MRSRRPSASNTLSVRIPAATISGWATAVSRIVAASETVPCSTRSMPMASDMPTSWRRYAGSINQGSRKPGACDP